MADKYILDSCALLAHVYDETGADIVESVLEQAVKGNVLVLARFSKHTTECHWLTR